MATTTHGDTVQAFLAATRTGTIVWVSVGPNTLAATMGGERLTVHRPAHAGDPWTVASSAGWEHQAYDPDMVWWESSIPSAVDELLRLI